MKYEYKTIPTTRVASMDDITQAINLYISANPEYVNIFGAIIGDKTGEVTEKLLQNELISLHIIETSDKAMYRLSKAGFGPCITSSTKNHVNFGLGTKMLFHKGSSKEVSKKQFYYKLAFLYLDRNRNTKKEKFNLFIEILKWMPHVEEGGIVAGRGWYFIKP